MPRSYPVTPRNREGQIPKSENMNDAVRETLEVAQSLTSDNFQANSIPVEKVSEGTFIKRFAWSDVVGTSPILDVDEDNVGRHGIKVSQNTQFNLPAGTVKGNLQVRFRAYPTQINANNQMYGDIGEYGASAGAPGQVEPYCDFTCATRFTVYANGHKCGETEWTSEAMVCTVSIPCLWWHDGGDMTIELFAHRQGRELSSAWSSRLQVDGIYGPFLIRSR